MLHTEDMSQVSSMGDVPDKGAYLFRIAEVKEADQAGNPLLSAKGEPKVVFVLKVQDEGKFLGKQVQVHASLQAHALSTLKAVYTAVGYTPGPEGHDPSKVLDGELYAYGEPQEVDTDNGKMTFFNIAPWNMSSVSQGPKIPRQKA